MFTHPGALCQGVHRALEWGLSFVKASYIRSIHLELVAGRSTEEEEDTEICHVERVGLFVCSRISVYFRHMQPLCVPICISRKHARCQSAARVQ